MVNNYNNIKIVSHSESTFNYYCSSNSNFKCLNFACYFIKDDVQFNVGILEYQFKYCLHELFFYLIVEMCCVKIWGSFPQYN